MDWINDHAAASWLMVAIALAALELLSMDLILIMLAAGALVGMVVALLGGPFLLCLVCAVAASVGLLALIRPALVHRLHAGPDLKVGPEALIGKSGLVLEPVANFTPGRVKIGGDIWTAKPFDEDDQIEVGTHVEVVTIKGATAYVLRSKAPQQPES
ncbi:NfeD family protein [Marmoricola sp. RAF53]|uniref:NfeD family protein n=1 Tax=Marmoricola sp. RAF53 TaxID=3233059 RepID=UPI003F990C1D